MIRFFSINDILRYIVLFVLLLIIRVVFWMFFPDAFLVEIHYQNIAEQLTRLGESYVDVLHHLGPLSAGIFRYVYGGTEHSLWLPRILAFLLSYVQVLMIAMGINQYNGLREYNSFLGVIHIVLMHLFPDMIILSPLLIGITFICISYIMIYRIIKGRASDGVFLFIGILQAIAVAFLFPLGLFTIPTLLVIVFYTRFNARSIGLFLLGISLPILLVLSYYYFRNHSVEYLSINLYYGFSVRFVSNVPLVHYLIIAFVPMLLFVLAFLKILAMYNMVNYQQKMIVTGVFFLITAMAIFFLLPDKSPFQLLLFVPFLIHFLGILFIETNFRKINQLAFLSFAVILLLPFVGRIQKFSSFINTNNLYAQELIPSYGRILNLSDDKNILQNNKYATGFCEYMIAYNFFKDPSPAATILISNKLESDMPDAIYDPNDVVKNKFAQLPDLSLKYRYIPNLKIYRLISK